MTSSYDTGTDLKNEILEYPTFKGMGSHYKTGSVLDLLLKLGELRREVRKEIYSPEAQHLESIVEQLLLELGRIMRFGTRP